MVKVLKMPHKLFYVYEFDGDAEELLQEVNTFDERPVEIDGTYFNLVLKGFKHVKSIINPYYFNDQEEVEGFVKFKNRSVPFKLRSKSKLLFVETPYQKEKIKILKFFNNKFKNFNIGLFVPNNEEEKDFVCNTTKYSFFKVFIDNQIVNSDETNRDLCTGLMTDMELIEATLYIKIHNKNITFYYYGNAIQFPPVEDEDIEGVIQAFENTMIAQAK